MDQEFQVKEKSAKIFYEGQKWGDMAGETFTFASPSVIRDCTQLPDRGRRGRDIGRTPLPIGFGSVDLSRFQAGLIE